MTRLTRSRRLSPMLTAVMLCLPIAASAGPNLVAVEGASYNTSASMADNLNTFTGKRVTLTLSSGASLSGTLKSVGNHLVHIEKMSGKEFFDALVRIEDIDAMEARFREMQR